MSKIPGLRRVFRLPWRSAAAIARDVDDELAFHLEMRAAELERGGMAPHAARARALEEFGDVEGTRAYCREADAGAERGARRAEWWRAAAQDARHAGRLLRLNPGFALAAVLTLALGIGANTAVFSVVRGVLLRPLPFPRPERLVRLFEVREGEPGNRVPLSPLDLEDWRRGTRAFESVSAYLEGTHTLTGDGAEPERLRAAFVGAGWLQTLGVRPAAGRAFTPRRDTDRPPREALIGAALWRRRWNADPTLLGRDIVLDGERYAVIGVVPAGAEYPAGAEVWTPLDVPPELLHGPTRRARFLRVLARLAPGVTPARAQAELSTVARRLQAEFPDANAHLDALVVGLREYTVGEVRRPLLVLLGAVGLVMLIACANVANLLLARAARRETELAIRSAIGAGRGRLVRQLLTESVLLSLLGGAGAIALAAWGTRGLVALAAGRVPRLEAVRVDGAVLAATLGAALATGVLFGLLPALGASAPDLARALKEGGRSGRSGGRRARRALVVSEMALSLMLLAGAGLLIRSFARLTRVHPGFAAADAVTFTVVLPEARYAGDAERRAFALQLTDGLRRLPGARDAAAASGLPLGGASFILGFEVEGRPAPPPGAPQPQAQVRLATRSYFATMGIPLRRGRAFADADRAGSPPVAVINEAAARRWFAGEDPLGKTIRFGFDRPLAGEVVGVVGDVKQLRLDEATQPEVWLLDDQYPSASLSFVVRTAPGAPPAATMAAAKALVRSLDPDLPLYGLQPLDELVSEAVSQPRFYTLLLGAFAAVALVLAAVGVYGVIAYAVAQRTREIGVRVALGATSAQVLRLVLREGLALTLAGLALGTLAALWATRLMASLLYGVTPSDPAAFLAGAGVLVAVGMLACWVPARRAARVDPIAALRAE